MLCDKTSLLFGQFALIGQAVSSPHRLMLLQLLCQSEKTVESLAEATQQSIASTSAHLKVLRAACLVDSRKQGRFVYYRLSHPDVMGFWLSLRQLGERVLPEAKQVIGEFFDDRESLVRMTPQEVLAAVKEGRVVLLDVRPAEEYAAGHLPMARSIPADELEEKLDLLPKRKPLLIYCRGPYCVTAIEAVRRLGAAGLRAHRLAMGVVEWQAADLPLGRG